MILINDYIKQVLSIATQQGYKIEVGKRNKLEQIDFGNKKLHAGHLEKLYPRILEEKVNISMLINEIAPGRPCSHKPMREIIEQLKKEKNL
ncbi:MAG: hypothetical protein KAH72_06410 [Flavobacteriaceae bacterium]|nr:hypothetical protein [Flavobacteriaceae bacterium]